MNETFKYTVHALNDLSSAVWFGGNLFGIAALNSGVRAAHSHTERGAVLNQSWENFAPYSVASALTFGATWAAIRFSDPRLTSKKSLPIARTRDWLAVAAIASTAVSGVLNRQIAEAAPHDRVPVEGGTDPAPETPEPAASAQIAMRFVAAANLAIGGALIATGSILEQQQMDAGFTINKWLPINRRATSLDAIRMMAAVELLRRSGKLLGESVEALWPHEPTTAEKIKGNAIQIFERAAEVIGTAVGKPRPERKSAFKRLSAAVGF